MGIFNSRRRRKTYRPHILLQQLEERIVLDATVSPTVQENPLPGTDSMKDGFITGSLQTDTSPANADGLESMLLPAKYDYVLNQDLNVVLVSNAIGDVQGISAASKENAQVIVFDPAQDNLASINAKLATLVLERGEKIDVLAVVTHGSDNTIEIGQDYITRSNFFAYEFLFDALAENLTADAQLQFYSCDAAESEVGEALVSSIALATGADAFASKDATGGPRNNWTLEYSTDPAIQIADIFDLQALGGLSLELGGQPGEPGDAWFHGTGVFQGWDIYNYSQGVYYTEDYKTYWDHQDSGAWRYYNTVAWVTTDNLGNAPYGDGNHYAGVDTWFTAPSGVGSYSGHQAYIGTGVEYLSGQHRSRADAILGPLRVSAIPGPIGTAVHGETVTGFEAYPQETRGSTLAPEGMTVTIMQEGCTLQRITRLIGTIRIPEGGGTITRWPGSRPTTSAMRPMETAITMRAWIHGSPYRPGLTLIPATRRISGPVWST